MEMKEERKMGSRGKQKKETDESGRGKWEGREIKGVQRDVGI